jgi:hypothetical protein
MLGFLEKPERNLHGQPQFLVQRGQLQRLRDPTKGRQVGLGMHVDQTAHLLEKPGDACGTPEQAIEEARFDAERRIDAMK